MAPYLALLLLDIFLDMGVIPAVCQSDNEFTSLAFEEMCSLLGCTQLFSTALRPQSQGIVERSHRDIRAALATVVEAYIRACPRKWPQYLRYLESKLRHKSLPTGDTPYSAIHGFKGSTSLSSALGAIEAIPEDVVHSDWLDLVVSECKDIGARLTDHWAREAEIRARKHGEKKPEPCFREGQLVLLQKPFYERGTGSILPQCDGPYAVSRLPTAHTAVLEDPLTGELFDHGKPVSVQRLTLFNFPEGWAGPDEGDLPEELTTSHSLIPGDFVAVEPPKSISPNKRVHVGRVELVHRNQNMAEVVLYHVGSLNRVGPWQRRPWTVMTDEDGRVRKCVLSYSEILCKVHLQNSALTQESLETLARIGIDTGSMPSRDSTLPPRH